MTLPIVLQREARLDFDEAFDWYEQQRPGLGVSFIDRVQQTFDRIAERPEMYGVVLQDVRRAFVRRFPYTVLYRIEPDRILVVAVFHTSRDPGVWHGRV